MFELQVRPIDQWPRAFTKHRKRGGFTLNYGTVMRDVERELEHIAVRSSLLLMALAERDIRIDGRPRAGARPEHPGVILVAETRDKGTLRFPCDTYDDWTANLRAITLHLKALRAIDRYGVSVSGEQYTGWKALPSPNGDHWGIPQARAFIEAIVGAKFNWPEGGQTAIRLAEMKTHPDKGGNATDFNKVQQARKLLLGL